MKKFFAALSITLSIIIGITSAGVILAWLLENVDLIIGGIVLVILFVGVVFFFVYGYVKSN